MAKRDKFDPNEILDDVTNVVEDDFDILGDLPELTEDEQKTLDAQVESIATMAKYYGYSSANAYLRATYGTGANQKTYAAYYTVNTIASSYYNAHSESLKYTNEDFRAFEKDKMHDYNSYSYGSYTFIVNNFLKGGTKGEDGKWSSGALTGMTFEAAYDSLTGYNPTVAKQKFEAAIAELTANAEKYGYDATKDITIIYGASVDNAKQHQRVEYLQALVNDLAKGTALEGKIKIVLDASAGSKWSDAFRAGDTQIGFGYGFSGNPFNPFSIIGGFVDPDDNLNYHTYWDTSVVMLKLALPAGEYDGAGQEVEMSLQNWYYCLNGLATDYEQPVKYNLDAGYAPAEVRLMILAALEEKVLQQCYSVMLIGDYGGSFLGAKFSYFSEDEHTFMGFGGLRYIEVNYTDAEWQEYVKANNGDLSSEYKKSE